VLIVLFCFWLISSSLVLIVSISFVCFVLFCFLLLLFVVLRCVNLFCFCLFISSSSYLLCSDVLIVFVFFFFFFFRCKLEPGQAWEQAQLMYDLAGFPYPPNDVINAVKAAEEVGTKVTFAFLFVLFVGFFSFSFLFVVLSCSLFE
jgi:hypothetical protein